MAFKYRDGMILGAVLGLFASTPSISVWTTNFLNSIIPTNFYVLGSLSLSFFGIIIGGIIGYVVDRT